PPRDLHPFPTRRSSDLTLRPTTASGTLMLWAVPSNHTQGAISFGMPFVVNSTGDGDDAFPGDGVCETQAGSGVCTLRAAIEETEDRKSTRLNSSHRTSS